MEINNYKKINPKRNLKKNLNQKKKVMKEKKRKKKGWRIKILRNMIKKEEL